MKKIIGFLIQIIFSVFSIQQNKLLFETCNGEVKDHLKALYDYLNEHNIYKYKVKWVITKGNDVSQINKSEIVYRRTLSYYYHLLTSKYWLRTHSVSNIVKKRKEQIYIQLWHSPGAIKKEGYDMEGIENTGETIFHAKEWDFFIATDEVNQAYIKSATNIKIPRILLGSCRSDVIVNADEQRYHNIRNEMRVLPNEKLVLYAPTFREKDFELDNIELKVKELCQTDGIRVILRLHPEVKTKINISEYDSSVIDGNKFPDIVDLYHVADIMVTDYSSVCIEFALLNKPILYYMYDLDDYQIERGFYYNYLEHLAGPIIKTEIELIDAILNIEQVSKQYEKQYEEYNKRYNQYNDGHVCERFVQMLQQRYFEGYK